MKRKVTSVLLTVFSLQVPVIGFAHEKGNHATSHDEKPNCEAMENMDHSKMDMNDPVMQAMMQKCMSHDMKGHDMNNESGANKTAPQAGENPVQHKHKR